MQKSVIAILAVFVLVAVSASLAGCGESKRQLALKPADLAGQPLTVGNHSWIPLAQRKLGCEDLSDDEAMKVLIIVDVFEKQHSELEVTGWRLEMSHNSYGYWPTIFGIWVDHRSKPVQAEAIEKIQ